MEKKCFGSKLLMSTLQFILREIVQSSQNTVPPDVQVAVGLEFSCKSLVNTYHYLPLTEAIPATIQLLL